ncbi:ATP-dependent RNA helicase Dbp9p [Trichomonascus vanleenenianus]|uniref:ATP-dependent DNA/RNA helicase n=1 Tax=Trichomonascus vanleenenianus TaxID=2268995 RepID=UPI003ECB3B3F
MSDKTFKSFGLDTRLLQAIGQQGFASPTLIQETAIPLALQDKKDIVAKAKTGSGKTAAYVIPIIQQLLDEAEQTGEEKLKNRALILVPSRELADQVQKVITKFAMYCDKIVRSINIAQQVSDQVQASLLADSPAIIVATPARAVVHVNNGNIDASQLKYLVIDEADLVLSYGYDEDLAQLEQKLPIKRTIQTWLMSATLSEDVDQMKSMFCRNAAVLRLENDEAKETKQLTQYYLKTNEFDKFLLAYVIFKLRLVNGKTLIFVNDVFRSYRLKLFLGQFGIKACVLNSELPMTSRLHIVDQFNKNVYNLLIATDEHSHYAKDEDEIKQEVKEEEDEIKQEDSEPSQKNMDKKKKKQDIGVSRGVDFQNVSCVLNFDLPTTSKAYIHRIGRTARANKTGMAISFVVEKDQWGKHKASSLASAKNDEKVLSRIIKTQSKLGNELEPFKFDMKQVEGFRYRAEDVFRSVTQVAVREAQVKEFEEELLNSKKLQRHFEENPEDLAGLRHDKDVHSARQQAHLKRVPEYLVKKGGPTNVGMVGFKKTSENRIRKIRKAKSGRGQKKDPLRSFRPGRR